MSRISVKIHLGRETIRLPFELPLSRKKLMSAVSSHWGSALGDGCSLVYVDNDGDTVLIGEDDESLVEAAAHHSGTVLNVRVVERPSPSPALNGTSANVTRQAAAAVCDRATLQNTSRSTSPADSVAVAHPSVVCHGCGTLPIIGPRYTCGFCVGFDLCSRCHTLGASLHDATHPWWSTQFPGAVRMHAPSPGPVVHVGVQCDACGVLPISGIRWHCSVCEDFDLCTACEARNTSIAGFGTLHTPTHALLKISHPAHAPISVRAMPAEDMTGSGGDTDAGGGGGDTRAGGRRWRGGRRLLRALLSQQLGLDIDVQAARRSCREPAASAPRGPSSLDPQAQAALTELAARAATVGAAQAAVATQPTPVSCAASPACQGAYAGLSARFVAHLAPLATQAGPCSASVEPGACVVRAWRVVNEGTRPWPPGTALVYVGCRPEGAWGDPGGAPLPAVGGVPVPCAVPGAFVDVALPLVAPPVPGRYIAYFRLHAPSQDGGGGARFGQQLRADLLVEREALS